MNPFKKRICEKLSAATGDTIEAVGEKLEVPPDESWGDYGFPCFELAKKLKKAPPLIAGEIATKIRPEQNIEGVSSRGPYVNFNLDKTAVIAYVCNRIISEGINYGSSNIGKEKTVVIEFSSPNIAKPMSIGHLRGTVLGAALKRIYERIGYRVVSINHIGDWGTQFGKLVVAYKRWADPRKMEQDPIKELYRIYVKLHEEAENDSTLEDESRAVFKKLEDGDGETRELWRKFVDLSWRDFERIYNLLGIKFDSVAGESFYQDRLTGVVDMLKDKGLTRESQGALIAPLEDQGLEPMLLRKKDGSTLYGTRDLAAAIYRHDEYKFEKMLYVVGSEQQLHFRQFFKVLELAGHEWVKNCYHVEFGWVTLGGESMSTRKGNIVFLDDVIAESIDKAIEIIRGNNPDLADPQTVARQVGVGAVVFTDLSVRRQTDVSFDWERMLDFQGHSGPYLQYAHARVMSVLRKADLPAGGEADYTLLKLPEEYALGRMMLDFPERIEMAAELNEPNVIAAYLLDLAGLFSTYYQKYKSPADKILADDQAVKRAKINLTLCVKYVLKSGLDLLGIETPERM